MQGWKTSSSSVLGMRVSWAKTKLQNIGSGVHGHSSNITVDGNTVEQVDNFIIPRQHSVLQRRQSSWCNASHRSCVVTQSCLLCNKFGRIDTSRYRRRSYTKC